MLAAQRHSAEVGRWGMGEPERFKRRLEAEGLMPDDLGFTKIPIPLICGLNMETPDARRPYHHIPTLYNTSVLTQLE